MSRQSCLALCLLASCGNVHAPATPPAATATPTTGAEATAIAVDSSEALPDLEALFRQDRRWRGADAAYSIALEGPRALWIFQDSWIVPRGSTRRKDGGTMVRNTLALFSNDGRPAQFYFGGADDKPNAAVGAGDWIWPLSGVRIGDDLLVFGERMVKSDGIGFASAGSLLFRVSGIEARVAAWQWDGVDVPYFGHSSNGDLKFGAATLRVGDDIYIYGVREDWMRGPGGRDVIVAKTSADSLAVRDFSSWRFGADWDADIAQAQPLFSDAATEMSVSHLPALNQYVAVYTHHGNSARIVGRFADSPGGPWSDAVDLYRCPEPAWSSRYFSYAAKAHPELASGPNELVISYVANSTEFADHVNDERIYWPRFVRVRLRNAKP